MDEINDWKKNLKGAADFFEVDAELLLKRLKERGVTDNPKQYFSDHKNLDYEYEIGPALKPISPIHSFVETLMLELNTEIVHRLWRAK